MTANVRTVGTGSLASLRGVHGFTVVELVIALSLAVVIIGTAIAVTADAQNAYRHALDDAAARQEARHALDWIARVIVTAGSDAYGIDPDVGFSCAGVPFTAFVPDPDGDGVHDDLRVLADVNPPNGLVVGDAGVCDESGEDVTIALDREGRTITRRDRATDAGPLPVTDAVFTDLRFEYLTSERLATLVPDEIAFVRMAVTAESRARHPATGEFTRFRLEREIHVRSR
jgi:hypothetical protein